jgi:uncharacterized protein
MAPGMAELTDHTDLVLAARARFTSLVRQLLSSGADPDSRTSDGTTALIYASRNGDLEVVRDLLAAHANVNARPNDGETALFVASQNGEGRTALHLVTSDTQELSSGSLECVRLLLDVRVDPNSTDNQGATPLMNVARFGGADAATELVQRSARSETRNGLGLTALAIAIQYEQEDIAEVLRQVTKN